MRTLTGFVLLGALSPIFMLQWQSARLPDYRPMEFLVGHCWVGTFSDGRQTDEHCFEWVFDHKFIRDRHVVRNGASPYAGETLYGWDPKAKRLAFWYWNSDGEILRGTVEYTAEAIVFPTEYESKNGLVELRAIWTPLGPDGYQAEEAQRVNNKWKTIMKLNFKRKS
jgi:hypothetical protein